MVKPLKINLDRLANNKQSRLYKRVRLTFQKRQTTIITVKACLRACNLRTCQFSLLKQRPTEVHERIIQIFSHLKENELLSETVYTYRDAKLRRKTLTHQR